MDTGALTPGSGWGMKLTIHLHLQPRLRMYGVTPPFFWYIMMVWCLVIFGLSVNEVEDCST